MTHPWTPKVGDGVRIIPNIGSPGSSARLEYAGHGGEITGFGDREFPVQVLLTTGRACGFRVNELIHDPWYTFGPAFREGVWNDALEENFMRGVCTKCGLVRTACVKALEAAIKHGMVFDSAEEYIEEDESCECFWCSGKV